MTPEPDQVPVEPVSFFPSWLVPDNVGNSRPAGPVVWAVTTAGVATLTASWDAGPAVTWTTASRACPVSAGATAYVFAVAPRIGLQSRPFGLQRCHWYATVVGVELQLPGETWSV